METIEQTYQSYDYSATRCYVFQVNIPAAGFIKIEHKLPKYIKRLKGIFVTLDIQDGEQENAVAGFISLNFNGQSLKAYHNPVLVSDLLADVSIPYPLDEPILPNSLVQGYYNAFAVEDWFSHNLTIYLHYL